MAAAGDKEREAFRHIMVQLKAVFDSALLAGFTQREAMELTSLILRGFMERSMDLASKKEP